VLRALELHLVVQEPVREERLLPELPRTGY